MKFSIDRQIEDDLRNTANIQNITDICKSITENAVLGAELLAGMSTLGAGAAVVQSGKILVKQGIKSYEIRK